MFTQMQNPPVAAVAAEKCEREKKSKAEDVSDENRTKPQIEIECFVRFYFQFHRREKNAIKIRKIIQRDKG